MMQNYRDGHHDKSACQEIMSLLFLADPETASLVQEKIAGRCPPVTETELARIVHETIWGLSREAAFGHAVATGLIALAGKTAPDHVEHYCLKIREAGEKSAAIGRIMATHLVPVLLAGDKKLIEQFTETTQTLLKIGSYTLSGPLEALSSLLESGDIASGLVFLELLGSVLTPDLSYNQCKSLCHVLSAAVQSFSPSRRLFQIGQLMRVARADSALVDVFLDGMNRGGASLLETQALHQFVSSGLARFNQDKAAGCRFLSIASQQARDLVDEMQTAVPFSWIQHGLNRYLLARTGSALTVRPLSELLDTDAISHEMPMVCTCANRIFLPDEISRFDTKAENVFLYKCLTRLEACYQEFGTYAFDLEKAVEACQIARDRSEEESADIGQVQRLTFEDCEKDRGAPLVSDMNLFCRMFPNPALAADLLTIFEHGRIRSILSRQYPGIHRQALPALVKEATRIYPACHRQLPLEALYVAIALGFSDSEARDQPFPGTEPAAVIVVGDIVQAFNSTINQNSRVEDCAALVWKSYSRMVSSLKALNQDRYLRLKTPFGWGLRPDLAMDRTIEAKSALLKHQLADKGIRVYKSQIRKLLVNHHGNISRDDMLSLIRKTRSEKTSTGADCAGTVNVELPDLDFTDIPGLMDPPAIHDIFPATWYREWNRLDCDYLHNHVRVVDRTVEGTSAVFYNQTLERYRELVSQIRYAFEMMKPEGLKLLRNWTEGDELDYRAILDFVVDQKAGRIPSDRLYIKRIRQERNVAVLLLVDLSRSTGNAVAMRPSDAGVTVLDVEKEAIVLFCEALNIVGDTFAIAGFSGNGRLSVDYTHIKEFEEPLNDAVRKRIGGLTPQRSTRMGAAIRHATSQLERIPVNVRLMVVMGDGFPNDVDYKQGYAISDTRKAIGEALSRRIHTHAITVNMQSDTRLDDLYGSVHHNVISDIRELPAKLLRIYGALTRSRPVT